MAEADETGRTAPTEDEVLGYAKTLSNWGRWGADDRLGTLNLITPQKRAAAAALVRAGRSISCAWDIEAGPGAGAFDDECSPPMRIMIATGQSLTDEPRLRGAREFFGLAYHGYDVSHLDALSHVFWDRRMYNARTSELVNSLEGATELAVTDVADGVVTRGVLLDVARARGVDWLAPGEGVYPDNLEAAERLQGVTVEAGDAVVMRSGYGRKRREHGRDHPDDPGLPGWHAACLPWLRERGVAMIVSDTATDVLPPPYPSVRMPVHAIGVVAMGLWIVDNCDLEALARACDELSRWEFLFTLAPLRIAGGTGSPVNPLAIL